MAMRHLLNLALSLFTFLMPSIALAHDFVVDGIFYKIRGNEATVTFGGLTYSEYPNEYSGTVVIPESVTYNGVNYPVTSIDSYTFRGCSRLDSVTIPNSVITIGESAFIHLSGLSSVIIGNSVKTICRAAFYGCSGLTTIHIPNSLTSIGQDAFGHCSGITTINIPDSVIDIGQWAFQNCTGLISVSIGKSVTSIPNQSFMFCPKLASITIASDNRTYDSRNNCNAIIETNTNTLIVGCQSTMIPNSVTSIGMAAFYGSGVTNITIPSSVTSIGESSFSGCTSLKSVTIPNSVTAIGNTTFYHCTSLANVIIGNAVTAISENAFNQCEVLANVTCLAETPPVISDENSFYPAYTFATLHVPAQSVDVYKSTPYWIRFSNIIGDASEGGSSYDLDYMKCDTNSDGEVNIADVNRVIDAILNH